MMKVVSRILTKSCINKSIYSRDNIILSKTDQIIIRHQPSSLSTSDGQIPGK